jgi:hypothetical protein
MNVESRAPRWPGGGKANKGREKQGSFGQSPVARAERCRMETDGMEQEV